MFFKWALFASLLGATAVFSGCSRESENRSHVIEVQFQTKGACLTAPADKVNQFMRGELSSAEVTEFWDCFSSALAEFQRITTGDRGDRYSPQALRQFFQKYFIHGRPISDPMLNSLMEIKRIFLSGTTTDVTRAELTKLQALLVEFKSASLTLLPFARVLFLQDAEASDLQVRSARLALQSALSLLGRWLLQQHQGYSFLNASHLIQATGIWLQTGEGQSATQEGLENSMLVIPDLKGLLLGGSKDGIDGGEWLLTCQVLSEAYSFYLSTHYAFAQNLDAGLIRPTLPEAARAAVDLLAQGVGRHPNGQVPLLDWHMLFQNLQRTHWLPSAFTAPSMDAAFVWLLRRPLGDGVTTPTFFNQQHIASLRQHIDRWLVLIGSPARTNLDPTDRTQVLTDFKAMLAESNSLEWDDEGRMVFSGHPPSRWSLGSRRHLVAPYVILRLLKESYVDASHEALAPGDMNLAVAEILPLLQGFGWLTTTDLSVGKRRFREADLFTLSGNGDGLLQLGEATRYTAMILSALRSAQYWLQQADQQCGDRGAECVRQLAFDLNHGVLSPVPRLRALIPDWGRLRFRNYMLSAETVILAKPAEGQYQTGDLLQVWQLFEFAETFMQRFGQDGMQTINLQETLAAYPIFGPTINNLILGGGAPDDLVLSIFTFLMKYGDSYDHMWGGLLLLTNWQLHKDSWELHVERDTLMSILAQLSKR